MSRLRPSAPCRLTLGHRISGTPPGLFWERPSGVVADEPGHRDQAVSARPGGSLAFHSAPSGSSAPQAGVGGVRRSAPVPIVSHPAASASPGTSRPRRRQRPPFSMLHWTRGLNLEPVSALTASDLPRSPTRGGRGDGNGTRTVLSGEARRWSLRRPGMRLRCRVSRQHS